METTDLKQACRICLEVHKDTIPLNHKDESHHLAFKEKISSVFAIDLLSSDDWPARLCYKCKSDLDAAYRFRMNLEAADVVLQSYNVVSVVDEQFTDDEKYVIVTADDEDGEVPIEVSSEPEPEPAENDVRVELIQIKPETSPVKKEMPPPPAKRPRPRQSPKAIDKEKFVCDQCGKSFAHKLAMQTHLDRHSGIKPFNCQHCSKTFAVRRELENHMRSHTGEKPFQCRFGCDRRFGDWSSRTKHERTHTGEKPYKCTYCDKAFAYSNVLKVHLTTHTGDKRFQCEICQKRFAQSDKLKNHLRTHGIGQPAKKRPRTPRTAKNVLEMMEQGVELVKQEVIEEYDPSEYTLIDPANCKVIEIQEVSGEEAGQQEYNVHYYVNSINE